MKERQRWQPEEDAILRAYVRQYGPREWHLISQRTGKALERDAKSCLERWKNYLRPGIKRGSLTAEEQSLVISLQAKYGNKWKKIAAEVPGRTAKRLGKWWEVFKEKQTRVKSQQDSNREYPGHARGNIPGETRYDRILDTFAEKYVQQPGNGRRNNLDPVLSLGSGWMGQPSTSVSTSSPTISLSLSPVASDIDPDPTRMYPGHALMQYCNEVEEGRLSWEQNRKEAAWRLGRLEKQLEAEKGRRRKEEEEEVEERIWRLREEEAAFMAGLESDFREKVLAARREAEEKEAELIEAWCSKHLKLVEVVGRAATAAQGHYRLYSTRGAPPT